MSKKKKPRVSFILKKVVVPSTQGAKGLNRRITRKRQPSPIRATSIIDERRQFPHPTIVLKRHYPSGTWVVPPLSAPLYWFDRMMVDKGWIIPVPPNTFVVDGRRFKVLAQDQADVGRYSVTRWLVYEENAVPKGQRP